MNVLFVLLTLLASVLWVVYYVLSKRARYWEKKNVPHLKSSPLFGDYRDYIFMRSFLGMIAHEICNKFPNAPYVGTMYGTEPALLIRDPELLKLMTTKDFYYFSSREVEAYNHREVATQNLFFVGGDRWKVLRQNLTPLFSSAKMKSMFHLIEKCSRVFEKLLDSEVKMCNTVDIRALMSRFTMDCIGSCAFGVDTDVMGKDKANPFSKMGDLIFEASYIRGIFTALRAIWPKCFYGLGLRVFPKQIDDFFKTLLVGVFKSRHYQPTPRNDFVDLVLTLNENKYIVGDSITSLKSKNSTKISLKVDDDLLTAQCMLFFAAGFETSATTLSYTLYELAKHQDIQSRVLEEVDAYCRHHDNKLDYSCVTELPYLETCIDEALRLYPVLAHLTREVVEDYTLPDGLELKKSMRIHIPVYHLHHNPEFFPEPEQYRPERFSDDEKHHIIPYTYMPFGEGPRICIGMRFAKMQMMAGFVTLLKKYRVELADGMPKTIQQFEPRSIITQPVHAIRLKLIQREGWEQRVFKDQ